LVVDKYVDIDLIRGASDLQFRFNISRIGYAVETSVGILQVPVRMKRITAAEARLNPVRRCPCSSRKDSSIFRLINVAVDFNAVNEDVPVKTRTRVQGVVDEVDTDIIRAYRAVDKKLKLLKIIRW